MLSPPGEDLDSSKTFLSATKSGFKFKASVGVAAATNVVLLVLLFPSSAPAGRTISGRDEGAWDSCLSMSLAGNWAVLLSVLETLVLTLFTP